MSSPKPVPRLDVDGMLDSARIIVCCGSGGVGKTTTAAALALRAAERGRSVVVLTIDPARRLAQSMGLTELDNTPREVKGVDESEGGRLDAMMLDMKRTFDEIVVAHSTPERAEKILENPFYQSLSSSFSGTQEYMAMEKLGQLKESGEWDLVVVDTPPTRSALDFLDAPQSLARFLDGRLLRLLVAPAKAGGRAYMKVLSAGFLTFARMFTKIIGAQTLQDVSQFVAALETMFGGFRQRAEETYRLLAAPGTAFVVVSAPEPAALREASYFVDRLAAEKMPLAGLVLNRVTRSTAPELPAERALAAAEELEASDSDPLAASVLRVHAERVATGAPPERAWPNASRGRTPRCRRRRSPPWPATCTTSTACAPSRRSWPKGRLALARRELTRLVRLSQSARPRASARAVSSRTRQEATSGRRRSRARRSRSVMPPQTPNSTRLSSASARHSVRTTQPKQRVFARFCAAPWTNSSSGSVSRQAARVVQSLSVRVPTIRPAAGGGAVQCGDRHGWRLVLPTYEPGSKGLLNAACRRTRHRPCSSYESLTACDRPRSDCSWPSPYRPYAADIATRELGLR